jgi:hypothetical protein
MTALGARSVSRRYLCIKRRANWYGRFRAIRHAAPQKPPRFDLPQMKFMFSRFFAVVAKGSLSFDASQI